MWKNYSRQDMGDVGYISTELKEYAEQFVQLVELCGDHHYSLLLYHHIYEDCGAIMKYLTFAQIAAILVPFVQLWNYSELWKEYSQILDRLFKRDNCKSMFLLQWAVLRTININKIEMNRSLSKQYEQLILEAINEGAFQEMRDICDSNFIGNLAEAHQIRLCVYQVFEQLYENIEVDDNFWYMKEAVTLLASFLKDKEIATKILSSKFSSVGCFSQLLRITEIMFPHDFKSFSMLMRSQLAHKEFQQQVLEKLKNIEYFAEATDYIRIELPNYKTVKNNFPMVNANIYAQQQFQHRGQNIIVHLTKGYAYIDILLHIISQLLNEELQNQEPLDFLELREMVLSEALEGLDLLLVMFDCDLNFANENVVGNILDQVFRMLVNYLPRDKYNHEVINRCLKLCVTMMPLSSEKILYYLNLNHLLPMISIDKIASEQIIDLQSITIEDSLLRIMTQDLRYSWQDTVTFVIGIIKHCFNSGEHYRKNQMSLTIFLLQKVLPTFTSNWYTCYNYEGKLTSIANILQLLQQILQNDFTAEFCAECFEMVMTNQSFIQAFYIIYGNIKTAVEQSSLENAQKLGLQISNVCISIVLLLIEKTGGTDKLFKQPFGAAFVKTNAQTINNLKVLVRLINNSLDPSLCIASCRLLIKFVDNSSIPILAHLDMDSNQVRGMFLERLIDPFESDEIKVGIVDLISASIPTQFGLTTAFFNVREPKDKMKDLGNEVSLQNFIIEFLKNAENPPKHLSTPLGYSVFHLVHQLWQVNDVNLTTSLSDVTNFWTFLTHPLFGDLKLPCTIYSKIISILTINLRRVADYHNDSTTQFNLIIDNLFRLRGGNPPIVKIFHHMIHNQLTTLDKDLEALQSIRNFLIMLILKKSKLFQNNNIRRDIAFTCLEGLQEHIKIRYNSHIMNTLLVTYIYVITKWDRSCFTFAEFNLELSMLTEILNCFVNDYQSVAIPYQENLLTVACKIIQIIKNNKSREPSTFKPFLETMRTIYHKEQGMFMALDLISKNWILLLIFMSHLLDLDWISEYKSWFYTSNFIQYVFMTVSRSIKKRETLPIAKVAMQTLVKYAQSDMYMDISVSDLESFYYNVNPSAEFLHIASYDFKAKRKWPFEEFWLSYTGLFHLNTILLRRSPCRYLKSCLTFFAMHWTAIESLFMLPNYTMELTALELVQSILDLGCELLQFKEEWQRNEMGPRTIIQFLEMVNRCMNSCIQIMISPNILKFFSFNNLELIRIEDVPCNNFVKIMNDLLQIITTSCVCYNKISPSLITLMRSDVMKIEISDLVTIQHEFTIPQINKGIKNRLCYENLLCLMQILCKALNQILPKQETKSALIPPDGTSIMSISQISNEPDHHEETVVEDDSFDNILAFVCPNFVDETSSIDNLDVSTTCLSKLNLEYTSSALETLGTYLASQILLLVTDEKKDITDTSYYRWNLCIELQMFHDYITRRYEKTSATGFSTHTSRRGHPVQYIMAPQLLQSNNTTNRMATSDSEDFDLDELDLVDSDSECSIWGIAPDVNPWFPDAFIAWRDNAINDNFMKPCFPEYEAVDETISEEYYLPMISHWFENICKLSN